MLQLAVLEVFPYPYSYPLHFIQLCVREIIFTTGFWPQSSNSLLESSGATSFSIVTISEAWGDIYDRFKCHCLELDADSKVCQFLLVLLSSGNQSTCHQKMHCLPAPQYGRKALKVVGLPHRGLTEIRSVEVYSFHGEQISSYIETSRTAISRIIWEIK